jgi:hypothetical protein
MEKLYGCLISEANNLRNTFTISYNVAEYKDELFSSTYDELSMWVRKALKLIETNEKEGKESYLYRHIRKFRGRAGDITLNELKNLIHELENAQ